ncbi:MAG: MBL fold metallo-hydrolase [Thermoplasmatales archaeon]
MRVTKIVVGPLATNCYLAESDGQAVIIDPGAEPETILSFIENNGIEPKIILATHGHFDHILAVSELREYLHIPFIMSIKDTFLVDQFRESVKKFLNMDIEKIPKPDSFISGGSRISIGSETIIVLETPGHTPGSCSFRSGNVLFTGDFIFRGSIGRMDFGGSKDDMRSSLKILLEMDNDVLIYPGHGPESSIGREKNQNPFILGEF